jgi:hypothetical protein
MSHTISVQCSVVRRANALNTPWVLNKPRQGHETRARFVTPVLPPLGQQQEQQRQQEPDTQTRESPPFLVEEYTFTLSTDADCQELPFAVERACGIPAQQLRLCLSEEFDSHSLLQEEEEDSHYYEECAKNKVLVQQHTKVTRLQFPKNKGQGESSTACVHFFKKHGTKTEPNGNFIVNIVAFETTMRPRPPSQPKLQIASSGATDSELEALIEVYGNGTECRIYDTEALPIARAISQSLWPRNESELRVGLRVDAMDHTGKWYPGTIVDIVRHSRSCGSGGRRKKSHQYHSSNSSTTDQRRSRSADRHRSTTSSNGKMTTSTTIRVHFDNFSSKWDENFTLEQFFGPGCHHHPNHKGMSPPQQVIAPLYTQVLTPRTKPTEFLVHHRYTNRLSRNSNLFGQSFLVQCHSEWSTVRAAAHIIAQASRFLDHRPQEQGCCCPNSSERVHMVHKATTTTAEAYAAQRLYDRTQRVLSDLLDKLIDLDRHYVQHALGLGVIGVGGTKKNRTKTTTKSNSTQGRLGSEQAPPQRFRNPGFDVTPLTTTLHECLKGLLRRMPFELLVCTKESLLLPVNSNSGGDATNHRHPRAVNFPLSLERTIGNYMNGHLVVVVQWREPPSDSTTMTSTASRLVGKSTHLQSSQSTKNMYLDAPVMYVAPARRRVNHFPLSSRKEDDQQPSHPKRLSPTAEWEDMLDRTKSSETSSSTSAIGSGGGLIRQPKTQNSRGPIRVYRYMQ